MTTIGIYAHHDGRGHLDRATAVTHHLRDLRCTVASSHPEVEALARPGLAVRRLPGDVPDGPTVDRTAHGRLHHAPLDAEVAAPRVAALVEWVRQERPAIVLVDVSTEVLLTLRLAGVPVAAVRLHGNRSDAAHRLAFDLATSVVAPFPRSLESTSVPPDLVARTFHAGLVHPPTPADGTGAPAPARRRGRVLVAWGAGSPPPTAAQLDLAAGTAPTWHWAYAGPPPSGGRPERVEVRGWVPSLVPLVREAEVVVGPCGDGLLAAVAAGGGRYVALPQERPFAEQHDKAAALARRGVAVVVDRGLSGVDWSDVLHRARATRPPGELDRGVDGGARLADHLRRLAQGLAAGRGTEVLAR